MRSTDDVKAFYSIVYKYRKERIKKKILFLKQQLEKLNEEYSRRGIRISPRNSDMAQPRRVKGREKQK